MEPYTWTIEPDEQTRAAATEACDIQDACNGRAVLAALVRRLDAMPDLDGDKRNQHPVLIAYLDKLASLAKTQYLATWDKVSHRIHAAHEACYSLRNGESVEWEIFPL